MTWDDKVVRHIGFKGNATEFYRYLNRLLHDYLPVLGKRDGAALDISSTPALVHGAFWSRAIRSADASFASAPLRNSMPQWRTLKRHGGCSGRAVPRRTGSRRAPVA